MEQEQEYTVEGIQARLGTIFVGRKIELHRQVGSTNDLVRAAGRRGESEGLVVLAEEQAQGRGRLGRTWAAPPGSSILCSVLLRPRISPQQAFYLTIAASLAILRGVREISEDDGRWTIDDRGRTKDGGRRTVDGGPGNATQAEGRVTSRRLLSAIKWPNDVMVKGKKVAGVLSEGEFVGGDWGFAIVGFGINVNLSGGELERLRAFAPKATSLSAETGMEIDRVRLLARILEELESLYLSLHNGKFGSVYEEWASKMETIGRPVLVDQGNERIDGVAVRVETDGALIIRARDGRERRVLAGDIE